MEITSLRTGWLSDLKMTVERGRYDLGHLHWLWIINLVIQQEKESPESPTADS
jgi:hypothetical protein